jgi:hypothetical protein
MGEGRRAKCKKEEVRADVAVDGDIFFSQVVLGWGARTSAQPFPSLNFCAPKFQLCAVSLSLSLPLGCLTATPRKLRSCVSPARSPCTLLLLRHHSSLRAVSLDAGLSPLC